MTVVSAKIEDGNPERVITSTATIIMFIEAELEYQIPFGCDTISCNIIMFVGTKPEG